MVLYMVGIGLNDEKDISVKGLEAVKNADVVYLESYTSLLQVPKENLESFYSKEILLADRELVEKRADEILSQAKEKNIAFLIVGDVFGATTHADIFLRAQKEGIQVEIIHSASVLTAVGVVGLELYKYGKTTSTPYEEEGFVPETPYDVIKENQSLGLHTLVLLDIKPDRKMSVNEAIEFLWKLEDIRKEGVFSQTTMCVGCARLGSKEQTVKVGSAEQLKDQDFGSAPHCLIIPGNLHFIEEEMLAFWKQQRL